MKNNRKPPAFLLALALLLCVAACGPSVEEQWTEQYETAMKLLDDGEYEQAVIAFTAAIEIDPKRAPAYAGRSDSYHGLVDVVKSGVTVELLESCETVDEAVAYCLEMAIQDMQKAIELDPENVDYYNAVILLTMEKGDLETMMTLARQKFEHTDDTEYQDLLDIVEKAWAFMDRMAEVLQTGVDDDIFAMFQEEGYADLLSLQEYLGRPVLRAYGENWLGLYPLENASQYGNFMVYFGQMADGLREGTGAWYGYSGGNNYSSHGDWAGDIPNGTFAVKDWNGNMAEDVAFREISGNVQNGRWNGAVVWAFDTPDGYQSWDCAFVDGIGQDVDQDTDNYTWSLNTREGDDHGALGPAEGEENIIHGIVGFIPEDN